MHRATIHYHIHRAQHGIAAAGHHVENIKRFLTRAQYWELKKAIETAETILFQVERESDHARKREELEGYAG